MSSNGHCRVVQVIPCLLSGGLERVASELTLGLARRGDHVVVASSGGEPFQTRLEEAQVAVELIPRPRPNPWRLLTSGLALARVLRRERPDVVHAHNPAAGAAAAIARAIVRRPDLAIVTTYHGVEPDSLGRAQRALALSSDVVVGCGPAVTRKLVEAGLPQSRSATVFNALEIRLTRTVDDVRAEFGVEGAELVVNVGRYEEQKNQALLIDALALLAPRRPRLRALIVGVGTLEDDLRRRVRDLGLEGVVTLTGERQDAHDIMAAADVFALSSVWEALPLVLIEAMALARPIVATDVTGVGDLIRHESTGLLVPSGHASALADGIERLLEDHKLATRLGTSARELAAERCSEETMVSRYRVLYGDAIAGRRR
jgi:glycosyltransferase involved in cell wall biosynthesis